MTPDFRGLYSIITGTRYIRHTDPEFPVSMGRELAEQNANEANLTRVGPRVSPPRDESVPDFEQVVWAEPKDLEHFEPRRGVIKARKNGLWWVEVGGIGWMEVWQASDCYTSKAECQKSMADRLMSKATSFVRRAGVILSNMAAGK